MVRHFLWEKDQVGSIPAYLIIIIKIKYKKIPKFYILFLSKFYSYLSNSNGSFKDKGVK